jgi:hypothetical protein
MKYLTALVFIFCLFDVKATEIKVRKMLKDGDLERSHVLATNLKEKVVLDCQSFIQGLRIGVYEQAFTFLMDPQDCDDLTLRIRSSLRKFRNHCIDVEEDIRSDRSCD